MCKLTKENKVAEIPSQNSHNGGNYIILLATHQQVPPPTEHLICFIYFLVLMAAAVSSEAPQVTVLSRLALQALQDKYVWLIISCGWFQLQRFTIHYFPGWSRVQERNNSHNPLFDLLSIFYFLFSKKTLELRGFYYIPFFKRTRVELPIILKRGYNAQTRYNRKQQEKQH